MRKQGKRNPNLTSQLKLRMKELDRIGESRAAAKSEIRQNESYKFGDTVEGIHSIQTMKNYNQVSHEFIKWAKEQGAGNRQDLQEVIEKYGVDYLKHREGQGLSTITLKRDRATLNKIMKSDKKIEHRFQKSTIHDITRSRANSNHQNVNFSEQKNADLVSLAKGTGGRRSDLKNLKTTDFYEKGGRLYVRFEKSKGGKDRVAVVREEHRKAIQNRIDMTTPGQRLFERIHTNADIHSYRRDYAQNLYKDVLKSSDLKADLSNLYGKRHESVKSEYYQTKGQDDYFKGLRDDVFIVTNALGHNRLDVAVNHYLR